MDTSSRLCVSSGVDWLTLGLNVKAVWVSCLWSSSVGYSFIELVVVVWVGVIDD